MVTQEDTIIVNTDGPNIRVSKYIKQITNIKAERDKITVVLRDFNVPLSMMDTVYRQKISKNPMDMNVINKMDLTGIYRTIYPIALEYTSFSSAHGR